MLSERRIFLKHCLDITTMPALEACEGDWKIVHSAHSAGFIDWRREFLRAKEENFP